MMNQNTQGPIFLELSNLGIRQKHQLQRTCGRIEDVKVELEMGALGQYNQIHVLKWLPRGQLLSY